MVSGAPLGVVRRIAPSAIAVAFACLAAPIIARDIAFVHVNVVPMDRDRVLRDQTVLVRAELAVGMAHSEQGNFPAALAKLQLAVDHARQVGDDPMLLFHASQLFLDTVIASHLAERAKTLDRAAIEATGASDGPVDASKPE